MTIATIDPGAIYVSTFDNNTVQYQLHRYRPGIGTTLLGTMNASPIGLGEGRDGFLYGGDSAALFKFDPLDPFGVFLGVEPAVSPYAGDFAADLSGTLFGIRNDGDLVTIDKDNGAQTVIGPSLAFWGLSFSRDGRLWGSRASNGNLYQIDPMTGAATFVMATVPGMADLASQLACGDGTITGDETCDDGNLAAADGCSGECLAEPCFSCTGTPSVCTPLLDATPCDDGSLCTTNGTVLRNRMRQRRDAGRRMPRPLRSGQGADPLQGQDAEQEGPPGVEMVEGRGDAIGDFGTPLTTTSYELCIYNATPSVIGNYRVPAGGMCADKPCWKADTKKAKYNDKELTPDGVQKLQLKPSAVNGKAKALLKGKGARLVLPTLPIPIANLPSPCSSRTATANAGPRRTRRSRRIRPISSRRRLTESHFLERVPRRAAMGEVKLVGAYGSPYSRKMRAVLRYRRIPFRWIVRASRDDVDIPPVPVALIPVLVLPGPEGDTAMIDSTFQIRRLESGYAERRVIPGDPALAFLDALVEDYADEWLTKAMYHYRWAYAPDAAKASHVLPCDQQLDLPPEALERGAQAFARRQIGRLSVVGSNETTGVVIEASYRRLLALLDAHLRESPFLLGRRPGTSDFGLFGQLSQLAQFDPTSASIAAEVAPRVVAWVIDSTTSVGSRLRRTTGAHARRLVSALAPFFAEIGRVYAPFLLANAAAIASRQDQVECGSTASPGCSRRFRTN